jgi:hypothetical protein
MPGGRPEQLVVGLVDVYAAILRDFHFEPELHAHYGEKVVTMRDGLPKYLDIPAEMGGSGQLVPD